MYLDKIPLFITMYVYKYRLLCVSSINYVLKPIFDWLTGLFYQFHLILRKYVTLQHSEILFYYKNFLYIVIHLYECYNTIYLLVLGLRYLLLGFKTFVCSQFLFVWFYN